MVVSEAGADGHVEVESAVGSVEIEFRGVEWIVLMELKHAVVEASLIGALEAMEAKVEFELSLAPDK